MMCTISVVAAVGTISVRGGFRFVVIKRIIYWRRFRMQTDRKRERNIGIYSMVANDSWRSNHICTMDWLIDWVIDLFFTKLTSASRVRNSVCIRRLEPISAHKGVCVCMFYEELEAAGKVLNNALAFSFRDRQDDERVYRGLDHRWLIVL